LKGSLTSSSTIFYFHSISWDSSSIMARKKSVVDQGSAALTGKLLQSIVTQLHSNQRKLSDFAKAISILAPDPLPFSLPRRKSMRLAQTFSPKPDPIENEQEFADTEGEMMSLKTPMPRAELGLSKLEVAIPLKKTSRRSASSSVATEDTSADGRTGYDTPATSVAVTPAESDVGGPKKRVSASARARDLRSSTMSLGARRGVKRPLATDADEFFTTESADAALARSLQMQEYGETRSKRQKTLNDMDIASFTDDDDLSDLNDDEIHRELFNQPAPQRKARVSLRSTKSRVVLDSDDMMDDSAEDDVYQDASDSSASASSLSEEEPPVVQSATGVQNVVNNRGSQSRRQRSGSAAARALASGMSYRVSYNLFFSLLSTY
jgi:DNA repair protein RAD16